MTQKIRVVVADDHPVVRSGMRRELEQTQDIIVVGEANNGVETVDMVFQHKPDVVLLDVSMPETRPLNVIRELCSLNSAPKVIMLTAHNEMESILAMLRAGASGYVLKDEELTIIVDSIRAVYHGALWLSERVTEKIVSRTILGTPASVGKDLSERELEVLRFLAKGSSPGEIAQDFRLAESTVKNHLSNIYKLLNVTSRVEAVIWAWEHGIVIRAEETSSD